jgi:transposase
MAKAVRSGAGIRETARRFHVSPMTVSLWVKRSRSKRLDRTDFLDRRRGPRRPWNRISAGMENRIIHLRIHLKERSTLGEYGAAAIQEALRTDNGQPLPSLATINRVLSRHGLQDDRRRKRNPSPPKGWYLPDVVAGKRELDSFDFVEDLKIKGGPLFSVLTGISLHGALADAWVQEHRRAGTTVNSLLQRWKRDGLPGYIQFDNDTVFQGAHQFPDAIGRVCRLSLALGVTPVFAPPREPGFQNAIEGFNGLWQRKVWQRKQHSGTRQLQRDSDLYIKAYRTRHAGRQETAPSRRPFPKGFRFNLNAPLKGTLIFLRRTDASGRVSFLGRSYLASPKWCHCLVRCEVDLTRHQIRIFALRRKEPTDQPMLVCIPYHRVDKPFQGKS